MRKIALFVLLLSTACLAQSQTDDYSITVHVSASRWVMEPGLGGPQSVPRLHVVIHGKKYELAAPVVRSNFEAGVTLLTIGDYKAKLIRDPHKTPYESSQAYEFQYPDKKTQKFIVVAQSE